MFATLIEFKDAALAGTALATAAGTLARALRSDSFFLFGPECFRSGISGASESDLAHVASLLEPGNTFRECSAHIASALLLVSQNVATREKAIVFLCDLVDSGRAPSLPHLVRLAMRDARQLAATTLETVAKTAVLYFLPAGAEMPREVVSIMAGQKCLHYILSALCSNGKLTAFSRTREFAEFHCIMAMELVLQSDNRRCLAKFVAHNAQFLLSVSLDQTVPLLLLLPQGRRIVANVVISVEQDFRRRNLIPEREFCNWIRLVSVATERVGLCTAEEERRFLTSNSYLSRYLPLFDHVVSSSSPAFEEATIRAALTAMLTMADAAQDSQHTADTVAFMRDHQPQLAKEVLRNRHTAED